MRRTFLSARPSRAVYHAFVGQRARRTYATVPTKDDSPPSPIMPSKEQAHPVGPFYEAILRTPKPFPQKKPEEPPVTSQESPAAEEKPSQPAAEDKAAADEDKKPAARRPRKPKQPAAAPNKDETPKAKSVPSSSSSPSFIPTPSTPETRADKNPPSNNDPASQARIIIGSRLAGPAERAERLARLRAESRLVAGVLVPPKPEEPDNCCMSGCVNCVWDRYRDEMEEWAFRSAEAERRLRAMEAGGQVGATEESFEAVEERGRGMQLGVHDEVMDRMDEDGGGSSSCVTLGWDGVSKGGATGRIVKDFWDEELYKNVPVGFREFMKQEKRLKEKHMREATMGG
ncbi:hypothetical protein N657DRAFT_668921 [Parathielavia appendiculata]|uniref:Oxidoreductase-like domain-containing protein n=1 Tax=Parathielavia appendiculata TaxID=2587402 RepID=A0AAN6U6A1_9PEZI|nr:hypothetical protein N657DRAFT_668921 [Parathielavia appendiculata]